MVGSSPSQREVAVVTGASRGLGRSIVRQLLSDGVEVVGLGRDLDALGRVPQGLQTGQNFHPVVADLGDREGLEAAIRLLTDEPCRQATMLVNCAADQTLEGVDEVTLATFERVLFVNTVAPFGLAQALLPQLARNGRGTIVNISSDVAYRAIPGAIAYTTSKWGLVGMSYSLQEEVRRLGVRVCAVEPGWIESSVEGRNEQPDGAIHPDELARMVAWILRLPSGVRVDRLTVHPMVQGSWG